MKRSPGDDKQFETDVRNIARQLWRTDTYGGAITIEGRERDSVFVTEEVVHYIEMTTSKSEKKAFDDIKKISELLPKLSEQYPGKIAKGWWITLHEPTGEQGVVISRAPRNVFHNTYHQFLAKLIDSRSYIALRVQRPFGSARNIVNDRKEIPQDEYVPAMLVDNNGGRRVSYYNFRNNFISTPKKCLITGEFGVGKSMLARQIFMDMAFEHRNGRDNAFPVYINLRDHNEQKHPDECLTRHAKSLGYPNPDQLVRAWLAGYVNLILDGFDELTPILATRDTRRAKELRRASMELVRRFVLETPENSGLIVLGRSNFFDNPNELSATLGIKKGWQILSIPDFTDEQVAQYLAKKGIERGIPSWLPRRPLLIGYMIGKNLIEGTPDGEELDRVTGWKSLINLVCEREVDQVNLALETNELVSIYGRIGTKSRRKVDPLGPVSLVECRDAFFDLTRVEPEGRSLSALMRLPGLIGADIQKVDEQQISHAQPGSRWFVDDAFQSAVASEDVYLSIKNFHDFDHAVFKGVRHHLADLGLELVVNKLNEGGRAFGHLCGALQQLSDRDSSNPVLIDYFNAIQIIEGESGKPRADICSIVISELILEDSDIDFSGVDFKDCYVSKCIVSQTDISRLPRFDNCLFERLESHHDGVRLIDHMCSDSIVEDFAATFSGYEQYRKSSSDNKVMVLASILDKIFIQSRAGRLEGALKRGLALEQLFYVEAIIDILRKEGYVNKVRRRGETIWVPDLAYLGQVRSILRDPESSDADIVKQIRSI